MNEENEVIASPGVLQMTIQITRKETGKVEEYILTTIPEPKETKE